MSHIVHAAEVSEGQYGNQIRILRDLTYNCIGLEFTDLAGVKGEIEVEDVAGKIRKRGLTFDEEDEGEEMELDRHRLSKRKKEGQGQGKEKEKKNISFLDNLLQNYLCFDEFKCFR